MPYLTKADLRTFRASSNFNETASSTKSYKSSFDIFLSHSFADKEDVSAVKALLESKGYSVYVDWIEDSDVINREKIIDEKTAAKLKERMKQSKFLFLLYSKKSTQSFWCHWEIGCYDDLNKTNEKIFILPLLDEGEDYTGHQYLKIYKSITFKDISIRSFDKNDVGTAAHESVGFTIGKSLKDYF